MSSYQYWDPHVLSLTWESWYLKKRSLYWDRAQEFFGWLMMAMYLVPPSLQILLCRSPILDLVTAYQQNSTSNMCELVLERVVEGWCDNGCQIWYRDIIQCRMHVLCIANKGITQVALHVLRINETVATAVGGVVQPKLSRELRFGGFATESNAFRGLKLRKWFHNFCGHCDYFQCNIRSHDGIYDVEV